MTTMPSSWSGSDRESQTNTYIHSSNHSLNVHAKVEDDDPETNVDALVGSLHIPEVLTHLAEFVVCLKKYC